MSMTSLQLPEQTELEEAATAAEETMADAAAADATEGGIAENEVTAAVEDGDDSGSLDDLHDPEFVESDDAEDTLLEEAPEEPATAEAADEERELAPAPIASPIAEPGGRQLAAAANRFTPQQPPKSAALVAWEYRRAEARDRYEGAMFEWRKLEAAAKAAKERWKDAEDQLYDVLNEGGDLEGGSPAELPPVAAIAVEESGDSTAPTQAIGEAGEPPVSAPDNAWRFAATAELLSPPIPRFGKKRQEHLLDACPTMGDFEDRRAQPDGLLSIDGIGREFADVLEDRAIAWLSKHRDRGVFEAAANEKARDAAATFLEIADEEPAAEEQGREPDQNGCKPDLETIAVPAEAVDGDRDLAAEIAVAKADLDEPSKWTKQDREEAAQYYAAIEARAYAIFHSQGDFLGMSAEDALNPVIENAHCWESGEECYDRGGELAACPWLPGVERDDWLRGWMSAKLTNEEGWQGPGSEK